LSGRHARIGWLAVIAVLVLSRTAVATPTVVLVMAGGSQQELAHVEQRLRSELLAGGFAVTSVQVPEPPDTATFERTTSNLVTQAAVAVIRSESGVSGFVWASSKDDERTLVRSIQPVPLSEDAPAVFAIRASELLNAMLLELGWPKRAPLDTQTAPPAPPSTPPSEPEEEAPTPSVPAKSSPPTPAPTTFAPVASAATTAAPTKKWTVGIGVIVVGGPGGVPPGLAPGFGFTRRFAPEFAIEAWVAGPAAGTVKADAGTSRVDQELGVVRVAWRTRLAPWLEGGILGGVGGYRLGVAGRASPPNLGRRDAVWSALALLGAAARVPSDRAFALRAEAHIGSTTPRGQVEFLGQPVAQVGQPLCLGVLAAEYAW
jgi:hypothetical protein